ncbi:hypothetical protein GCM10009087_44660 [Sphingomonas oligophenolica]|uniref:CAP domain-containing protein n=1 Tax=Sphingomonas oligophenolica TaxID=301154 RepID=A0ABU9XZZ3_9SPHN
MRWNLGLMALALLAGCSAAAPPQRVVEERAFSGQAARGSALLRHAMIEGHNDARAAVGVPPLAWNATLAADAQAYATELARTGRFEHSREPRGRTPEGENLWTGTRGAYRYEEMVGHWVDEGRYYRPRPTPDFSTTGRWEDVAHYTEIIWRGTTEFGCAAASNATDDYVVCRYTPPGNVVGQMAF